MSPASSRSSALDACRGLAVLAVIVYHLSERHLLPSLPAPYTYWPVFGNFGVDLFYVLSGFFITAAILRGAHWQPAVFLQARISRIYPAYLVSMVLIIAGKLFWGEQTLDRYLLTNSLMHVLMLHNLLPGLGGAINGVYWTLGVEFPYYLFMLAIAPFLRDPTLRLRCFLLMLVVAISWRLAAWVFIPLELRGFASTQLPGALDAFALGGVMAAYRDKWHPLLAKRAAVLLLAGFVLLLLVLAYCHAHVQDYWQSWPTAVIWRSLLGACFALLVLGCSYARDFPALHKTALPWLGKISFSLYLYHMPVISLVLLALPGHAWQVQVVTALAAMLPVAWLSWRLVETRFHQPLYARDA